MVYGQRSNMGDLINVDFANKKREEEFLDEFGERLSNNHCLADINYISGCRCLKCRRRERKDKWIFGLVLAVALFFGYFFYLIL
jgi:hypothetical protein